MINDSYDKFCRILIYIVEFVIALIINTTKTSAQTTKHSCCNFTYLDIPPIPTVDEAEPPVQSTMSLFVAAYQTKSILDQL